MKTLTEQLEEWQELAEYEIPDYLLEDVRTLLLKVEEQTREELLALLPEAKEIDDPTIQDEFLASVYESQAEAWFAGWDNYRKEALKALQDHEQTS